jgi:hypothetical protein
MLCTTLCRESCCFVASRAAAQGAAGVLYFWSFMILVFLILLNFLLAIIVDAFSEIKEGTKERTGGRVPAQKMLVGVAGLLPLQHAVRWFKLQAGHVRMCVCGGGYQHEYNGLVISEGAL